MTLRFDTRKFGDVAKALNGVAQASRDRILARALNESGKHAKTTIQKELANITGLTKGRVAKGFKVKAAYRSNLSYIMDIRGEWTKITKGNFKARQTKAGVTHRAWNVTKRAKGAFMIGSVAVTRRGVARLPLKSLWGPNIVKELLKPENAFQEKLDAAVARKLAPSILSAIDRELARQKRKHGL